MTPPALGDGRVWDGRGVYASARAERRPIRLFLTRNLALDLRTAIARLRQTSLMAPESLQELEDAIGYVITGDPESENAWKSMEAGKGMTPDGGYQIPDHYFTPIEVVHNPGSFRCGYEQTLGDGSSVLCWKAKEDHAS